MDFFLLIKIKFIILKTSVNSVMRQLPQIEFIFSPGFRKR